MCHFTHRTHWVLLPCNTLIGFEIESWITKISVIATLFLKKTHKLVKTKNRSTTDRHYVIDSMKFNSKTFDLWETSINDCQAAKVFLCSFFLPFFLTSNKSNTLFRQLGAMSISSKYRSGLHTNTHYGAKMWGKFYLKLINSICMVFRSYKEKCGLFHQRMTRKY